MKTITVQLPDDLGAHFSQSAGELESEVRLAVAIDWFARGLISQGRAAEIAQVPRAEFLDALARRHIENVTVDASELKREMGE
jgi:predicted HTH domain antitoxin